MVHSYLQIDYLGVDVEKARKHVLSAYECSFVEDTQMMDAWHRLYLHE
jgi:hypothetical protein